MTSNSPFTLTVATDPNVCSPVSQIGSAPAVGSAGSTDSAVIIWDRDRIAGTEPEKVALEARLTTSPPRPTARW